MAAGVPASCCVQVPSDNLSPQPPSSCTAERDGPHGLLHAVTAKPPSPSVFRLHETFQPLFLAQTWRILSAAISASRSVIHRNRVTIMAASLLQQGQSISGATWRLASVWHLRAAILQCIETNQFPTLNNQSPKHADAHRDATQMLRCST